MKSLLELMEASKDDLPEIYCDLDEVLVDFIAGANKAVGGNFAEVDKQERWKIINNSKGFWDNLGWKPGGKKLYQFISRYDPHVLSAYTGRDPTSKNGKMKWLGKNTKFSRSKIHLVLRSQKKDYAKTEHIAVVVKAEHHCMTVRGVREHESDMTTAIMHGAFREDHALKQEFYDICLSMKGHSGN